MNEKDLGRQLRAMRERQEITQAQVSAQTGISRSQIANIESGRFAVTLKNLRLIAGALGFEVKLSIERKG
jgi:transcriptional regulator with XRE-family HTH domain